VIATDACVAGVPSLVALDVVEGRAEVTAEDEAPDIEVDGGMLSDAEDTAAVV